MKPEARSRETRLEPTAGIQVSKMMAPGVGETRWGKGSHSGGALGWIPEHLLMAWWGGVDEMRGLKGDS